MNKESQAIYDASSSAIVERLYDDVRHDARYKRYLALAWYRKTEVEFR